MIDAPSNPSSTPGPVMTATVFPGTLKPFTWLILAQAFLGGLAFWYYGLRISFGVSQMLQYREEATSMRWVDALTLATLTVTILIIRKHLLASRDRADESSRIFRITLLALLITNLFLCGLIGWGFAFVPGVPASFPPWTTGTTLAVTLDSIAMPALLIAASSFAAAVKYGMSKKAINDL